jgi:HSP20 family protein
MVQIRIGSAQAQAEPDGSLAEQQPTASEQDVWPGNLGRPFVLITHKAWRPPTDIYETPREVVVKMEVAGIDESRLQVVIHDDVLAIRGRRVDETARRKIGYHHMGIAYGEFASDIQLPGPVDLEGIRADYEAGFLTVSLPKMPPRPLGSVRIAVNE